MFFQDDDVSIGVEEKQPRKRRDSGRAGRDTGRKGEGGREDSFSLPIYLILFPYYYFFKYYF